MPKVAGSPYVGSGFPGAKNHYYIGPLILLLNSMKTSLIQASIGVRVCPCKGQGCVRLFPCKLANKLLFCKEYSPCVNSMVYTTG